LVVGKANAQPTTQPTKHDVLYDLRGVWQSLAETEFFMGQLDEAVADFKKALELNPDVAAAHVMLSQIYVIQGRPQHALPEIELVRSDLMRAYLYPIAYYALGQKKELDAALTRSPRFMLFGTSPTKRSSG